MQQFVLMTEDGLFCPGILSPISIRKCTGKCFLSVQCLSVAVCCAAPEVTDLPLCCVRASNLEKPHQSQFKGSTCPCHGWLHSALTGTPLLVILASSAPFSQSSSLPCPFPCCERSHYSMSVDLWEKSGFSFMATSCCCRAGTSWECPPCAKL